MTSDEATPAPKRENIWLNIGLNVVIPSILMTKGKGWLEAFCDRFGYAEPQNGKAIVLIVALAFPILYGIYDFITRKKYNFFSILGFVSILISGGIGLLELDKDWYAIKEAAIPALFAIAIFVSLKTPFPLVRTFLYNPEIFDVPKVEAALKERNNEQEFERLMIHCTLYLVASFVLSAILNYALAKYFIRSESNTDEFVQEMGQMTAWSWPVIVIPSTLVMMLALFKLLKGIKAHTGYEMEEVLIAGQQMAEKEKQKQAVANADEIGTTETSTEEATDSTADQSQTDQSG